MNRNFTCSSYALRLFGALVLLMTLGLSAQAQVNVALASNGGGATQGPTGGTGQYGPIKYIDGVIIAYPTPPSPFVDTFFSYVQTGGYIKIYKTSGAFFSFSKIVIFKHDRPITSCDIQIRQGGSYTTIHSYNNSVNVVADSVLFDQSYTTDTVRLNNVTGPLSNPSSREIQLWDMQACLGTPPTNNIIGYTGTTNSSTALSPCIGGNVYLNSLSNLTSYAHHYQWQVYTTANPVWTNIPGATSMGYSFQAFSSAQYRVVDTCVSSGLNAASAAINVNVTIPSTMYQPIPYYMGFDVMPWATSSCLTAPFAYDLPAASGWSNSPASGNSSWRIDTANNSATATSGVTTATNSGWTSPPNGQPATPFPFGANRRYARFHTAGAFVNQPGNLDLYLDCSNPTYAGNKQLYFYMLNTPSGVPGGDSLRVLLSTDGGVTFTKLASYDTAGTSGTSTTADLKWRKKSLPIVSNSATTVIRFQAIKINATDGTDIGLDSIYVAVPCTGTPLQGKITPTGTTTGCGGNSYTLSTTGTTMAGNLIYTWQQSTNGGVSFVNVTCGTGFNAQQFTTQPLYDTIKYRLMITCGTTGTPVYTDTVTFNIFEPQYAQIPYAQSFETTWLNTCGFTGNLPSINWANTPGFGNNSWRRNDAATGTSGWNNVNGMWAAPVAFHGNFAARFHSVGSPAGTTGNLDLLINASGTLGSKQLGFAYNNASGNDSLRVYYSADAGCTFTKLASLSTTVGWAYNTLLVPSNSANTIIRFQAYGDFGTTDIGLDTVTVIAPCTGAPTPGTITTASPCPGINFGVVLQGSTVAANISYQWEDSSSVNPGIWVPIGTNSLAYSTNITVDHWYRVKVTCNNSGITTITPVRHIKIAQFYYCYCGSAATSNAGADIGNLTIRKLPADVVIVNNGTGTPLTNNTTSTATYTDFRGCSTCAFGTPPPAIAPIPLYHDSTYAYFVTQINSGTFTPGTVSIWIDTDRNGLFDPGEKFTQLNTSASSNPSQRVSDTFSIPPTLFVGVTGMRVVLEVPQNTTPVPCGNYAAGETEDYLVDIRYAPCLGQASAGTAYGNDTSGCVGYAVTIIDTSHEHFKYNISWLWQYSPDGNSWADIPGSQMRDTVNDILIGQSFYRLRMICYNTLDTTYSNMVKYSINPPYACYCFSQAIGGNMDSSDIGGFTLGTYANNVGGPHLKNALAVRARTDYTKSGLIDLYVDSTYLLQVYHIMKSNTHGDAKVTIFMDLNDDLMYNITANPSTNELIYTGFTSATNFLLKDSITIPPYAITGLQTGMRVILNNNTGPNAPSDSACGVYTSGETEDYIVMFHYKTTGIENLGNISLLTIYPNPAEGRFNVRYVAKKAIEHATVTVTNITGQKVMEQHYTNPGKEFSKEFDASGMARGVYLVELKADSEKITRKLIVR
jgi:hypothetical protein